MEVDREHPPGGIVQRGRYAYPFCSDRCRERFLSSPESFFAIDPVCGMEVNPKAPRGGEHVHAGRTYYFCNPRCRAKFSADPGPYLLHGPGGTPGAAPTSVPPGAEVVWVCPMDPEVREKEPVPCPICGMALEPLAVGGMPSAEEPPNPELENMTRRFRLGLVPALAVLGLAMGDMLAGGTIRHALQTWTNLE
jgi:Cu+-exporting ATPase